MRKKVLVTAMKAETQNAIGRCQTRPIGSGPGALASERRKTGGQPGNDCPKPGEMDRAASRSHQDRVLDRKSGTKFSQNRAKGKHLPKPEPDPSGVDEAVINNDR